MIHNHLVILLITITFGFAVGNAEHKAELATPEEHPFLVSVRKPNEAGFCSGTIIGDKYVVTTANCVIDTKGYPQKTQTPLTVNAGSVSREVESAIYLKNYTTPQYETYGSNIAVLKLKCGFDLANIPSIAQANLPNSDETYEGKTVTQFGLWSFELSDKGKGSATATKSVHKTNTQVLSNAECSKKFFKGLKEEHLCSYHFDLNNQHWSCWMDRGSPLIQNNTVVGLLFLGPGKASCYAAPLVFMRISSYLEFINNAMNENITNDMVEVKL